MKPEELTYLEILRSVEAFKGLRPDQLRQLALIAAPVQFAQDQIIYRPGELGQGIYVVRSGKVAIEMDMLDYGPVTMYSIGPEQLFGWSSLFGVRRKKARARAVEPTRTIFLSAGKLQDLFSRDHNLEDAIRTCITDVIANRLDLTRQTLGKFTPKAA